MQKKIEEYQRADEEKKRSGGDATQKYSGATNATSGGQSLPGGGGVNPTPIQLLPFPLTISGKIWREIFRLGDVVSHHHGRFPVLIISQ